MGFLCKFLFTIVVTILLGAAFLPDTKTYFGFDLDLVEPPELKLPESFSGPLIANRLLNSAEHLFQGEIFGPEAFASYQGRLFTGLIGGRIIELFEDSYRTVARIDPENIGEVDCPKFVNLGKCGRPLGLRFDSHGTLWAADPFHGLYSINVDTGALKLVASNRKLDNAKFLDDLVLLEKPNGKGLIIYITDASTRFDLEEVNTMMAQHDQSGRLLKYDTETEQVETVWENLPFPNGLALTDDRKSILMASLTHRLLYKYWIAGPEAGKLVTLVDNLPGEPDNIKRSARTTQETYWVALFTARNAHHPHPAMDRLPQYPKLSRFIVRTLRLVGFTLERLGHLVGCQSLQERGIDIKYSFSLGANACKYGMVVEIDAHGRILGSMHSPDGSTCALSEVYEFPQEGDERRFLLGSAWNPYLGRLTVPKAAFRDHVLEPLSVASTTKSSPPKVVPKATTTEPTPTKKPAAATTPPPPPPKASSSSGSNNNQQNNNKKVEL